ncbi:MAG TPA: glycosyltransferase [Firmicutes bacterium]|nr:glycosyltransferase [Bacillota bacterium]
MTPTVSIIVPVYNGEKTLARCVDSILRQDFRDFELLLVDDGSTDSSGALCDRYAREDPRVRVIHKENGGVSHSRNMALDQARGVYLQFLDCDDWITPDATKLLVRTAQETGCDLVIAEFYRVVGTRVSHKSGIEDSSVLSREEYAEYMMEDPADFYYGVLWNKLYRRAIVEEHHLRMDNNVRWCEDFLFNLEYVLYGERFAALRAPVYYYVKTKGSLVAQSATIANTIRTKLRVFEYYHNFYKQVLDEEDYSKKRLQVYRFLVDTAGDGGVPPINLPGTKKLGDERSTACAGAVYGEGVLADAYRHRKLLDRYLEPVALQQNLTLPEIRLLLCLSYSQQIDTRKGLADFAGISRSTLTILLQRLSLRELIRIEDIHPHRQEPTKRTAVPRRLKFAFLPAAQPVLEALEGAVNDYHAACFSGFSQEELVQYAFLADRIKKNLQAALQ